ncbi:Helix-turn-helix domain-containing protein [Halogranum amylolyticum]|uniref:Helix-turn-helix domain-containing protein n=1 Tax=Halogranum amylolyticum TaxID=660520 RepID=A0A1H8QY03_9EURY|nr:helix-turn-helix domain-containing protein [Halogranum amylolyticum]SEO58946.1 Helix-turn-helix domain-containing protein [Halogranum amylolyticum]
MSQSQFAAAAQPTRSEQTVTVDDDETVQAMLDALDDADCRCILAATDGEALSASELSERCDLALSTTYRKLDLLTELDLLSERLRVRRSGKHASEYRRAVDDVTVSVAPDGIELRVTRSEREATTSLTA